MAFEDVKKIARDENDRSERELLRLANALGNVTEACRQFGVDRSAFYRALRRSRTRDGSRIRSPLAKSIETEKRVIALCLEYPEWGCDRLAWYLTLKGEAISSPTVQKILIRHGLGRSAERRAAATWMGEEGVSPGFGVP